MFTQMAINSSTDPEDLRQPPKVEFKPTSGELAGKSIQSICKTPRGLNVITGVILSPTRGSMNRRPWDLDGGARPKKRRVKE